MQASVIIPTYNRSDVILRSLATWVDQTIGTDKFEVIVVDNNSTDNTAELVNDFIADKPNFSYILETQKGSTKARHSGAKVAQSDILIFCDDDGLFNPECVQELLNVYAANDVLAAVAGKIEVLWDKEPPLWIDPYLFMLGQLDYGSEVIYRHDIYLNGGIFSIKKSVFNELGGFNPDLVGDYLVGDGDTGLVIKLHKHRKLIGWTPHAKMQHLQFVNKQGTEQDMGRRFFNTGISNAYGVFRDNNLGFTCKIFKTILLAFVFVIKKQVELCLFAKDKRKTRFSLMQRRGELQFFWNLRRKEIRKVVFSKYID